MTIYQLQVKMDEIVTSINLVGEEDEGSTKESAKILSEHVVAKLLKYWYWDIDIGILILGYWYWDIEHVVTKLDKTES